MRPPTANAHAARVRANLGDANNPAEILSDKRHAAKQSGPESRDVCPVKIHTKTHQA
jgi:hypothetical protein